MAADGGYIGVDVALTVLSCTLSRRVLTSLIFPTITNLALSFASYFKIRSKALFARICLLHQWVRPKCLLVRLAR